MDEPLVSIIIPTYNSQKTLPLTLKSIQKQTYKNIETIIVDNYSQDKTKEIAEEYGAKIIQVRSERAKAKNIGLKHAKGEYVLFLDSDMELTPRVIEECVKLATSKPEIAGIIIPERSVGNSFWVKVRDFERNFYLGTPVESPRFFRKNIALQMGGFDEDVIFYEEATLPYKIEKQSGYNVRARINSYILHHEEDFSLMNWLKKKYYYGKTARVYKSRYVEFGSKQISLPYRFSIFLRNKGFWSKPHLAFGVFLLKSLEYLVSGLGYISGIRPCS